MTRSKTFRSRLLSQVVAAIAVVALCGSAAQAALLHDLINLNQSITIGNLVFDQFSYIYNNDMPAPSVITVTTTTDGSGNSGLLFQGSFLDLPGNGSSSALIGFRVTSLGGGITGAAMSGNPQVISGNGVMSVTDTYLPENNVATLNIFSVKPGSTVLTDSVVFGTSYASLHVQKGILAASAGGVPQMTFVTQTFSVVPEPTTFLMAGIGLVGLGYAGWRKRRS
jgi:hypothetical protein